MSRTRALSWRKQQALGVEFELVAPDRPGFPPGPPVARVDFEAEVPWLEALIQPGDHLVAHSYGGVTALLAAPRLPLASLTVLEPPAFGVARGDPAVEAWLDGALALPRADPRTYVEAFLVHVGAPLRLPDPLPPVLEQGADAFMRERWPWEAELPLAPVPYPVLVVTGGHEPAFEAVGDVLERELRAERLVLPGAGHAVQNAAGSTKRWWRSCTVPDAIVIGAGQNGLVAANVLADAGLSVAVFEADDAIGGAVRSGELIEPGYVNDFYSAFYPLAVSSPAMRAMELERWGVRWCHGPFVLAHPTPDGRCVVLSRDLDETAASLDDYAHGDGDAWRELMRLWARIEPGLLRGLATPVPPVRAGVSLLARLGPGGLRDVARMALLPVRRFAEERFAGEGAALLLGGNALHTDLAPDSAFGGFFGFVLAALGQRYGFPFPEGGAGQIAEALARRAEARGVAIQRGAPVEQVLVRGGRAVGVRVGGSDVQARDVLAAVSVWELDRLLGRVPPRTVEPDPAVVKVDWTLDGTVPWTAEAARRAPVVHLAESMDTLIDHSADLSRGAEPARPFVLFGQYALGDPSRAPAGKETAWAYSHVPPDADAGRVAERMQDEVERRAPGFGELVRGRHVALLPPGRVNGGTAQLHNQFVFRGTRWGRPRTDVAHLYLASCSAHPGGGVHGAAGWNAATSTLRRRAKLGRAGGRFGSTA